MSTIKSSQPAKLVRAIRKVRIALRQEPSPGPFLASPEGEKDIFGVFAVALQLQIPQTPRLEKLLCESPCEIGTLSELANIVSQVSVRVGMLSIEINKTSYR
jgi:hypothetical protein